MPSDDIPNRNTGKPQAQPTAESAAVPGSRGVGLSTATAGLAAAGPERDMRPLLFDPGWYLQQNADVARAHMDPVQHYLQYGAREGRNPNAFFDTRRYLEANADVRGSPLNPFLHFVLYGFREGRDPSPPAQAASVRKPETTPPEHVPAPAPVDPPGDEALRQTLLDAMFTAAAETGGTGNRKRGAAAKPSLRSGTGKRR